MFNRSPNILHLEMCTTFQLKKEKPYIFYTLIGVCQLVFFTTRPDTELAGYSNWALSTVVIIRPDTGYFCVQDSVLFFTLDSVKSEGRYCIVKINWHIIHTVKQPKSTKTYYFTYTVYTCIYIIYSGAPLYINSIIDLDVSTFIHAIVVTVTVYIIGN